MNIDTASPVLWIVLGVIGLGAAWMWRSKTPATATAAPASTAPLTDQVNALAASMLTVSKQQADAAQKQEFATSISETIMAAIPATPTAKK